jgi:cation diffusion facilitator family transporter
MARGNITIYTALGANIAIAAVKFIVARITHSSAMRAEAVHSGVDSLNELVLLYGIYSSNKRRDSDHPFGYGRELYFWSFIVAILVFAFGAGVAFYQGYLHLRAPAITDKLRWTYIVLALSLAFEGTSFIIALKRFRKRTSLPLWPAIRTSKDPSDFAVLLEDGGAVLGILVVFILLFIGQQTGNRYLDGLASLLVGLILTLSSALLARESRSLLIGEGISQRTQEEIEKIIKGDPACIAVHRVFSLYQSPDDVLLVLVLAFRPDLTVEKMNERIVALRETIKGKYPRISYVVVQPESSSAPIAPIAHSAPSTPSPY